MRTCISVFVAQYSYPLNYKSSLSDFQVRTENNHLRFAFQKEREVTVLPVTPSRILFILFTIDHSLFMVDTGIRTLFLRCTDGRFTDKLEPTLHDNGFLPIAIGRTENTRLKTWCVTNYTIRQSAVRMRIELIATDRQSVMLAVTPTNR